MFADHIYQQITLMTFVIVHGTVTTDGLGTCQAIPVQALALVLCAVGFLLGDRLFALFELFDGLQGLCGVLADSEL